MGFKKLAKKLSDSVKRRSRRSRRPSQKRASPPRLQGSLKSSNASIPKVYGYQEGERSSSLVSSRRSSSSSKRSSSSSKRSSPKRHSPSSKRRSSSFERKRIPGTVLYRLNLA